MTGRWFGFAREAAVGGGLFHPHIVTVHDAARPLVELVVLDEAEETALLAALLVGRVLRDKLLHDEGRLLSAGRRWGVIMLGSAADLDGDLDGRSADDRRAETCHWPDEFDLPGQDQQHDRECGEQCRHGQQPADAAGDEAVGVRGAVRGGGGHLILLVRCVVGRLVCLTMHLRGRSSKRLDVVQATTWGCPGTTVAA